MLKREAASRAIIAVAVMALFAEAGYALLNNYAFPYVADRMKLTAALGIIGGSFLLVEAVMKGPCGTLADRFGRRTFVVVAPLAAAVVAVAVWAAAGLPGRLALPAFIVLRVLDGLAAAALWPAAFAIMAGLATDANRSSVMGLLNISYMAGIAVGPAMGSLAVWLTDEVRTSFLFVAVLFALTSGIAAAILPRDTPRTTIEEEEGHGLSWRDFAGALHIAPLMLVLAFLMFFGIGLLALIVPLLAREVFGLTEKTYGFVLIGPAVILAVLAAPLGRLGDHWHRAWTIRIGLIIAAAGMWVVSLLPPSPYLLALSATVMGAGFVMGIPAWFACIADLAGPERRGQMIGAFGTAQGVGMFLGAQLGPPLYYGVLFPGAGKELSHHLPLYAATALMTLGALLSLLIIRSGSASSAKPAPADG
jgi:MFS transporter, DHA1 family, multidrug resistance protein